MQLSKEELVILVARLSEEARLYHLLLADIVKACEHYGATPHPDTEQNVRLLYEQAFRAKQLQVEGGGDSSTAAKLVAARVELDQKYRKASKYVIHFQVSDKMESFTGRTVNVEANGFLLSAGGRFHAELSEDDQLAMRFVVAHELGHILLHHKGTESPNEFDTRSTNKTSELQNRNLEDEADDFASKILIENPDWRCVLGGEVCTATASKIEAARRRVKGLRN